MLEIELSADGLGVEVAVFSVGTLDEVVVAVVEIPTDETDEEDETALE